MVESKPGAGTSVSPLLARLAFSAFVLVFCLDQDLARLRHTTVTIICQYTGTISSRCPQPSQYYGPMTSDPLLGMSATYFPPTCRRRGTTSINKCSSSLAQVHTESTSSNPCLAIFPRSSRVVYKRAAPDDVHVLPSWLSMQ